MLRILMLLSCCVSAAVNYDYIDDFHYIVSGGTDAPEVSYMYVGRMQFNITVLDNGTWDNVTSEGSGFFVIHEGANGNKKLFFISTAHHFDMSQWDSETEYYTQPARDTNFRLISKGNLVLYYYGSVIAAEQKKLFVFPNGRYQPNNPGEAHIVRVPSSYPFDLVPTDPNVDLVSIELTGDQKDQFISNGGRGARNTDNVAQKVFQDGEVCKIVNWGLTDLKPTATSTWPARLKEAKIMMKDETYCKTNLNPLLLQPIGERSFACLSTDFGKDTDPLIQHMDSGAPVICGTGDGIIATIIKGSVGEVVTGPTSDDIHAFLKGSFYDT